MADVQLTINGRRYLIACADGEEPRLKQLAGIVDRQVNDLAAQVGQVGDARLLLMAALLFADRNSDLEERLETLESEKGNSPLRNGELEGALSDIVFGIEAAAHRVEGLAERLEGRTGPDVAPVPSKE